MGEDVNPQAYIVNLADCMLVLAVGAFVAMVSAFDVELPSIEQVESDSLEEVDPSMVPEDLEGEGSRYIEAGKVYIDPDTGNYYMIREGERDASADFADTPEDSTSQDAGEGDE